MAGRGSEAQALERLRRTWQAGIPLARHMHIEPQHLDAAGLQLSVPLAPNQNHMGSAFAGALQAAMTLAGWGLTSVLLGEEAPAELVAQSSSFRFLRPVVDDFEVVAAMPDRAAVDDFLSRYRRRGRARIALQVSALLSGRSAAEGEVRYAAIRREARTTP